MSKADFNISANEDEPIGSPEPAKATMRAFRAAGAAAWVILTAADLLPIIWFATADGIDEPFAQLRGLALIVAFYAVIGLPAALLISFTLGRAAFNWCVRRGRVRLADAAAAGLLVGAVAGLVSLCFTFVVDAASDRSGFAREHGIVVYHNGITAAGWALHLVDLAVTTVAGGISGLVAWFAAGLPQKRGVARDWPQMLPLKLLLAALTYGVVTVVLFGSPFQPISLATMWSDRLGVPYWRVIAVLCVIVSALVFAAPLKYAINPLFRPVAFVILAVVLPTLTVGLYADSIRHSAVLAFGADEVEEHSFFASIREAPSELQFFLHTAALKDCVPYAWSYRYLAFYNLRPSAAVNVLPPSWIKRCDIHVDRG